MAVLALFTGRLSKAQYDVLRKEVDWEGKQPPGGVFHAIGFDEQGNAHAADVWESAEALDAFATNRLMPAFKRRGLEPPTVAVFPLHLAQAYRGIDGYRI